MKKGKDGADAVDLGIQNLMNHTTVQGRTALRVLLTLHDIQKDAEEVGPVLVRTIMVQYGVSYDRMLSKVWAGQSLRALAEYRFCEYEDSDTGLVVTAKMTTNGIDAVARVHAKAKRSPEYEELLPLRERAGRRARKFLEASRQHLQTALA